jgi:signal transduction histidine kinase
MDMVLHPGHDRAHLAMTPHAPSPLVPADRAAHDEAAKVVKSRIRFFGHAVVWGAFGLFLLMTAGFYATMVILLSWGVGLALHGYLAVVAPELRQRWMEQEVRRRLPPPAYAVDERRRDEARSLERLAASIAHEIRNPITAAKSLVQQMREDPASAEHAEYGKVAVEELDRVERAVSHLLRYARDEEMKVADVPVADVVSSAIDGLADRIQKGRARVERDLDFDATVRGDAEHLRRVVMNLVANALDALEGSPKPDPWVRISCGRSLAGTEVWLRVKDDGPGIPPDRMARLFMPFETSKPRGTGLGLAIARKIVEAHGGTLTCTSEPGQGADFVATFPAGPTRARA